MNAYDPTAINASRTVLIDALTILGRYADELVVVGGWVPELAFPHKGHIGSLDVDLAIDTAGIGIDNAYTTIHNLLIAAGYQTTELPSRFIRKVKQAGREVEVKLDLITGDHTAPDSNRPQPMQDILLSNLRGVDLAFEFSNRISITGLLPDGGRNTVPARVCDPRAFLCMKGICLHERKKEKDAYDIYFTLREYSGGHVAMIDAFRSVLAHPLISEGLAKLRSKFSTVDDIGPVWASQVEQEQGGNFEMTRRDAFQRADHLLTELRIQPWPK